MARRDLSEELKTIWNRWLLPVETEKNHDRRRLCWDSSRRPLWCDSYVRVHGHYSI